MNLNELKLKDVEAEYLDVLLQKLNSVTDIYKNPEAIHPDVEIVMINTVKYFKTTLKIETIEEFNNDLLFSCIYKEINKLNEIVLPKVLNKNLITIITNVWENNSNFSKLLPEYNNIVRYLEYMKFNSIPKDDVIYFVDDFNLIDENSNKKSFNDFPNELDEIFEGVSKKIDNIFSEL